MKTNNTLRQALKAGNVSQIKKAVAGEPVKTVQVWMPVPGDDQVRRCVQTGEVIHREDLKKKKGLISLTLNINPTITERIQQHGQR